MSGEMRTYDPDRITATFVYPAGVLDLTQGLIEGAGAITESKDAPRWMRKGDRQSNYVRNRKKLRGGTLTFTYVAEAAIHDVISLLLAADDQLEAIVGVIVIRDLNGTTLNTYTGAFIEDDPAISYGDEAADRPYVFGYAERLAFLGGALGG